jgi:ribosomal protein S18 acetylase RimI-like enzyme
MSIPVVQSATEAERDALARIISLAFAQDPMARWFIPDSSTYWEAFPDIALAFGGNGVAHGSAYVVESRVAAALWLPPGVEPDAGRMINMIERVTPAEVWGERVAVFEAMARFHPEEPCWYLPLIGVDPAHQGRGLGAALMRHALARCDADGLPAYLESSNPRNVSLYLRHGFEILGTIQVGSSPELVPMLRRPQVT